MKSITLSTNIISNIFITIESFTSKMNTPSLSQISDIFTNSDNITHTLQLIDFKNISSSESTKTKYRLILSDGNKWSSSFLLSTDINKYIVEQKLKKTNILTIKDFEIYNIKNSETENNEYTIILIKEIEIDKISNAIKDVIGNPEKLILDEMDKNQTKKMKTSEQTKSPDMPIPIFKIEELTENIESWSINIRVFRKRSTKFWKNDKGSGKFFSFDVLDKSGKIRITAFRELVDKYFDFIKLDNLYNISNGNIKNANKTYSNVDNDYEITLNNTSIITEITDINNEIPNITYNIIAINEIDNKPVNETVDIIGICWQIGNIEYLAGQSINNNLRKRNITLIDETDSITLTLWNDDTENLIFKSQDILLINEGKIGEFNNMKYVSITKNSTMRINPNIIENKYIRKQIYEN